MKLANRKILPCLIIGAICLLTVLADTPQLVFAQDDSEEEVIPTGISPLSKRVPLLAFPLSVYPFNVPNEMPTIRLQEIERITVQFEDRTEGRMGLDILEDFLPMTTSGLTSGLALYAESGAKRGFNFAIGDQGSDNPIDLLEKPIVEADDTVPGRYTVTFIPRPGSKYSQLTQYKDQFADFYIVAQTSLDILHGDRFEISIPANGITITGRESIPDNTLYDERFPGDGFGDLNESFTIPAIFEGDIITIVSTVNELDNTNRIDATSESTSVLGIDIVGRSDQEYFIEEIRVNWLGLNLGAISRLIANLSQYEYGPYAILDPAGSIPSDQITLYPSFFYSPFFYNFPENLEEGGILTVPAPGDPTVDIPMTMPLDRYGYPLLSFLYGYDNPGSHYTSYVPFGPREPFAWGVNARSVTEKIFKAFLANQASGIFLYRELGGTPGKYDEGVDHMIKLDPDRFTIETFEVDPEEANTYGSPLRNLLMRLLPGTVGSESGKSVIPWLFGDDNLGTALLYLVGLPDASEDPRPPFGTLECIEDPDCFFLDMVINVCRPFLGLTEGQLRYLFEYTEGNGRTNAQDLYNSQMVQGFTFVMPVAKTNAISDLMAPSSRSGDNSGPDIYLAIRTSDDIRGFDSFIPFIKPTDIVVGTQVNTFTQGGDIETTRSVSSVGYGRPNTGTTYAMIAHPSPRFVFHDLTQPGVGQAAANNNVLYDRSQSSPPKAVIGIDAMDFGQNANLADNHQSIQYDLFDTFFTESPVLGEIQVEFLPGPQSSAFNSLLLDVIPNMLSTENVFFRLVTDHSIALYFDDDTPVGNGVDDDGDGLFDEEFYNLMDDDGDGLIDEDFGDGTPAGENGVFDSLDSFYPPYDDGSDAGAGDSQYVFNPNNSQTKFQDYITAILPDDTQITYQDGGLMPLTAGGEWFAELDMRVLAFDDYVYWRQDIFSTSRPFIDPTPGAMGYNMGMYYSLEPRTGLIDLVSFFRSMGGDYADFPYYPEDLVLEDAETNELIWMLALNSEAETDIGIVGDPDGDVRRTFALSLGAAMRIPNPQRGFVRFGFNPMVIDVSDGDNARNPDGENLVNFPYHQFGMDLSVADADAINNYIDSVVSTLDDAFENARNTIEEYNEAVADAEAAAEESDEGGDPEYPELPEVAEITITDPMSSLGITEFVRANNANYDTNYMYQIQIPDENFGPLAGDDWYIVLRSSADAVIGDSFRVRIRSGQLNAFYNSVDTTTGDITTVDAPQGGISYHSFTETDYDYGREAFTNVSKNSITTDEIVVRSKNTPPTISFLSPGPGLNLASDEFEFEILFVADDPDNVAEIRLFVSENTLEYEGTQIPGAVLQEGFSNSFTLNLLDGIANFDPRKEYYIYARIDDGVNPAVYTYADGAISTRSGVDDGPGDDTGDGKIVTGDLDNPFDYIKISVDGRLFNRGDAPAFVSIDSTTDVVDAEISPTLSGAILLQKDGSILGTGQLGVFTNIHQPNGELAFDADEIVFYKNSVSGGEMIVNPSEDDITIELARDLEVDWERGAIYILDGDGDMLLLGEANQSLVTEGLGLDLYRDMELTPNGQQMYYLAGNGLLITRGGSPVGAVSGIVSGDVYRDMELLVQKNVVTHIVITDEDGNISIVGPSDSVANNLRTIRPDAEITPGTIRQVKMFPDSVSTLMLVEGGGMVHIFGDYNLSLPSDSYVFADAPGLDDDQIVDTETASINLQSIVEAVRGIIDGIQNENVAQIMGYVSPDYLDRSGADATGLRKSLNSFFEFYEVRSYTESDALSESFVITNEGEIVNAQVYIDLALYYPQVEYSVPQVDTSSTGGTTTAIMLFEGSVVPFDQTIRVREVFDGRGWSIYLYDIVNFGRQTFDLIDTDEIDDLEDIDYLRKLQENQLLERYIPYKNGVDDPISVRVDVDEDAALEPRNVMAVFKEPYLTTTAPPAFEFTVFNGSILGSTIFDRVSFKFQREADGQVKLISMNFKQIMSENDSQFLQDLDTVENPLSSLDGQEVASPFGFSFSDRGPVLSVFTGDSDLIVTAEYLQATSQSGAIMMLPENTDIFAINPMLYVDSLTYALVQSNPFDPAGDNVTSPGLQASYVPGRAYFVITSDGRHFGFFQIPSDDAIGLAPNTDGQVVTFDFRYNDTFVLPKGF